MSRIPGGHVTYAGGVQRPVVIQPSHYAGGGGGGGLNCLFCTICPCIHLGFLRTVPGLLKIIELVRHLLCISNYYNIKREYLLIA